LSQTKTVCIKMITGEEIFAELIHDEAVENQNLLKLYQPYEAKVMNINGQMNMMLSPWQVFTDDLTYFVQGDHVVSINTLDERHRNIYGSMVTNVELKIIQNEVSVAAKNGTITAAEIDNALRDTYMVLMKSGIKYNIPLPEKDQVKDDFYTFLMGQYEDDLKVTH